MAQAVSHPNSKRVFATSLKLQADHMVKPKGFSTTRVRSDMKLGENAAKRLLSWFESKQLGQRHWQTAYRKEPTHCFTAQSSW